MASPSGCHPPRAQAFQERPEAALLRSAVEGGGTAVLHQSEQSGDIPGKVLAGMGGVGKTQLAADYARAAWDTGDLDVLVWITASTRLSVVSSYARAGRDLCRADRDDSEEAARAFVAWLTPKAGGQACRWLVVLDDLVDPDDLQGLWPPASPHGQTLVTTRRRDAALLGGGRHLIKVGVYTDTEAAEYLRASLADHNRSETTRELQALAHDLGHLPLALAQAAATWPTPARIRKRTVLYWQTGARCSQTPSRSGCPMVRMIPGPRRGRCPSTAPTPSGP